MSNFILGISAFYHDSAVTLLENGKVAYAIQEERLSRVKQDKRFPKNAIKKILEKRGINFNEISAIYYYENPSLKRQRIIKSYFYYPKTNIPSFLSVVPDWVLGKKDIRHVLEKEIFECFGYKFPSEKIFFSDHHLSHAASAYFPSPFEEAAILCIDGVGEWATTSVWVGKGNNIEPLWEIHFPHSIGLLYSAFTYFCGFKVDSGEYKLMGLAPYGEPKYVQKIYDNLIDIKEDGTFRLNMDYFDYVVGNTMISSRFESLFDINIRKPETEITQKYMDIAASIQKVTEDIVIKLASTVQKETGQKNLCMAGGVALNCVANGILARKKIFDKLWIQPAAGDAGGALGAAYKGWYMDLKYPRYNSKNDDMEGSYLGTSFSNEEIENYLHKYNAVYKVVDDNVLMSKVANLISEGKVIGWFSGRMEFGPRALGARSIIGDPRNERMQSIMNLKVKNRESFRPFAPVVLEEFASNWFDLEQDSPYMLLVAPVKHEKRAMPPEDQSLKGLMKINGRRSEIPAVTHVDYSARIQTVGKNSNSRIRELLESFYNLTDCPMLINTSFNVRGEPIVESPEDAYICFMRTGIDVLVLENYLLIKENQPTWNETENWKERFQLD